MKENASRKKIYFLLYIVFILIFFYAIQDFLTSRNTGASIETDRSSVHLLLITILIVLGLYFSVTVIGLIVNKRSIKIEPIRVALFLIPLWIIIVNLIQGGGDWSMAVQLGISMLWFLIFHFFCRYLKIFPDSWMQIQIFIMIMFLFYVFSSLYANYIIRLTYNRFAVVNLVYNVIVFMPWIMLIRNKIIRRVGLFIVFLIVILSMKRGAIVTFPLMVGSAMIVDAIVMKKNIGAVIKFISIMTLFFASLLIADQWSGGFLTERFSLENLAAGSGRTELYNLSIEDFSKRSLWEMIFGRGSGATIEYLGKSAHNEWLEFIFNYGIIGSFLYAVLLLLIGLKLRKLVKRSSTFAPAYTMAFVYMIVVGMFGMIYFSHSTLYVMAFYGAVEGVQNYNKNLLHL